MQRKVFYRAGAPILATRGDGLFETVGTLQQLIEEGRQQQRDLSQWLEAAEPVAATVPEATPGAAPEPEAAEAAPPGPASLLEPVAAEPAASPPKPPRQRRRRPGLVATEPAAPAAEEPVAELPQEVEAGTEMADVAGAASPPALLPPEPPRQRRRRPGLVAAEPAAPAAEEPMAEPPQAVEADTEMTEVAEAASPPAALPPVASRSPGRTAARAPAATVETPGQDRGKRWLMAGAARRGRAGKHWSTRQR